MKESHNAYAHKAEGVPQSHELASEEVRREVEARKPRDQKEQEAAEVIRRLILYGPDTR